MTSSYAFVVFPFYFLFDYQSEVHSWTKNFVWSEGEVCCFLMLLGCILLKDNYPFTMLDFDSEKSMSFSLCISLVIVNHMSFVSEGFSLPRKPEPVLFWVIN